MPKPTKTELEKTLKGVIKGLEDMTAEDDYTYYASLYPQGYSEEKLAGYAIEHPSLHPLMVKLANKIIEAAGEYGYLWEDAELQAGSLLTRALALQDKKYCYLFAECLEGQDLSHEVYQNEYIDDILRRWGLCDETAAIILVRRDDPGQCGGELMTELEEEYGEALEQALEKAEDYYNGGWADGEDEEGDAPESTGGHVLTIQDKRSLEALTVNWDEGYPCLTVSYLHLDKGQPVGRVKVFEHGSYTEVERAVADLKERCEKRGYAMQEQRQLPVARMLAEEMAGGQEEARQAKDVLDLFTPAGEQGQYAAYAGKPTVPCRKVQLFKEVYEFVMLFAEPESRRIYTPNVFDGQYLWSYDTEEEMDAGLEGLKREYLDKGYELVLEETVEYPFDTSLEMTRKMLG